MNVGFSKLICNFAKADRIAEARSRAKGWVYNNRGADACYYKGQADKLCKDIMESVYSTLFLGLLKLRNFHIVVRNAANSRCLVDMYIPPTASARVCAIGDFTHILREASASLLVLLRWAMRRPQQAERATSTALTLFFYRTDIVSRAAMRQVDGRQSTHQYTMAKKSAISGEYIITIEDSGTVRVCKIYDNVIGSLREIAAANNFEIDPKWNTQETGHSKKPV